MKNWLKKPYIIIILIIIASALFYSASFVSPFYREDRFFLSIRLPEDLFKPISDVHYHPISLQLFYFFSRKLFQSNIFLYHLVLFVSYSLSFFFIFEIVKKIFKSKAKALLVVFLYAFNISFFALYYWVAVSYFTIGSFFFFGSIYLFLKRKNWASYLLILFILLSLGSNEGTISLFPLFFLVSWYEKYFPKRLIPTTIVGIAFLVFRFIVLKLPNESHYVIHFDFRIFKTWEWFLWRALNLPEGIRFSGDPWLYILFFISCIVLGLASILYFKKRERNLKLLVFGMAWFTLGLGPFLLLPQHISSYYVLFAFLGFAILLVEILMIKKILLTAFLICYVILSVRGLTFLERTHYIILKNVGVPGKFYDVNYYPSNWPKH